MSSTARSWLESQTVLSAVECFAPRDGERQDDLYLVEKKMEPLKGKLDGNDNGVADIVAWELENLVEQGGFSAKLTKSQKRSASVPWPAVGYGVPDGIGLFNLFNTDIIAI